MAVDLTFGLWDSLTFSSASLIMTCILLVSFYIYSTHYRGLWEKYGIPVPDAWPIINHWPSFRYGVNVPLRGWFKKYGKTFGTYGIFPHEPVLITKDINLMKQILVKDFDNFTNRFSPNGTLASPRTGIFFTEDDVWRRCRHVTSPIFTGGKLRVMLQHVERSARQLKELVKQTSDNGELIPVKFFSGKFASDVIARVGFGVESHSVAKEESEFGHYANNIIRIGTPLQKCVISFSEYFPPLLNIAKRLGLKIDFVNEDADAYFVRILKKEMSKRRLERQGQRDGQMKPRDMLDIYMDSEVPEGDPKLETDNVITEQEIEGNITILLLAAFETVSSVLQSTLYVLATHSDIQEKIVEEVCGLLSPGEEIQYEHISQLTYIEQVINETLRMQPPAATLRRKAKSTKTYEGITIPGGSAIIIPVSHILKDPEHWGNNSEKFDPDRFSPENSKGRDPLSFTPFGWGPRLCVGQRFAMMELKIVLATLLREFRFETSDRSEPPKGKSLNIVNTGPTFFRPDKPVMVEAFPRGL